MKKKLLLVSILSAMAPMSADKLDDVIVTATRSEINTAEAPASVTIINRKEIEQKGASNVLDIIRGSVGVNLQGVGTGGRKGISLRGMSSKHTLILVDGRRIPATNDAIGPNTDYQYDWIPTGNIERVEVVRGPMSVLYGADALGGVINIITRKPDKELHGSIKLTGRSADDSDGHDLNFNVSGSANDTLQFNISAQQARRSSLESKLKTEQSAIEGRKKQQLSIGLDWQVAENHNIKLDITQGQEDRWYDTQTRRKVAYQSQYDTDREQISLGWQGSYGETTSALRVYQSKIDIINKATNGVSATAPQKIKESTLEGNLNFPVGQNQFITTGFEHRTEKLTNSNLKSGEDEVALNSVYLQDEIDLTDNLLMTLGARLDDHEVFGNETSPRASLVWNVNDKLILKGSYGHGFKAPTIKQSSADYVFALGIIKVTGNPDLKPETNNAFEIGANYSTDNYTIDAAIFDNKVKNLIELTGPITDRTYINISEAHLKGVEIAGKIKLNKALNLKTSYQYLDAKDGNGNDLKQRPQHTLSTAITWDKNDWQWHLGAQYQSGQIIEHNRVSTDIPGYTLWNAGVSKSINKNFKLAAAIDNLTDVRLEDKSPAFLHEEYPRTLRVELQGSF